MKIPLLSAVGFAILAPTIPVAKAAPPSPHPNLVVILLDDMGYSDIGCFGGEIETPNIDGIAARGVRFSQSYSTARCSPSRATLLTGRYSQAVGVGHLNEDWRQPGYRGYLDPGIPTVAEILRDHGYRTIMAGKWHLGTREGTRPWERGFDRFYGIPEGGGVYFWPTTLDRTVVEFTAGRTGTPVLQKLDDSFYSTDAFTTYALEQVQQARKDGAPFFLYLPYITPHFPLQAREDEIAKYLGRYREGWKTLRQARFERQQTLGIIDSRWELPKIPGPAWDSLSPNQQKALDRQMAVYAAMMENVDRNIGRLIDTLEDIEVLENTLVVFVSDNGAQDPPRPLGKDRNSGATFGTRDSFGWYALGWATLSNTPFRKYKANEHHGGQLTPLIIDWPGHVSRPGAIVDSPVHLIDLAPTLLSTVGIDPDPLLDSDPLLRGTSLLPFLEDPDLRIAERPLFFEHEGNRAVRIGDWKIVADHGTPWELYNVRDDGTELHDLASDNPRRVTRLSELYATWAEATQVLPWPVQRGRSSNE